MPSSQHLPDTQDCEDQDERRKWPRFPPNEEARQVVVRAGNGPERAAVVTNASIDGVSLELDNASDLRIGQVINVTYYDGPIQAIVRFVQPTDDGQWQLGLKWQAYKS